MDTAPKTLVSVQCLRAVAAWVVVLHHFSQVFFDFQGDDWFNVFFSEYGDRGVDLFFVISGFVMHKSTSEKDVSPQQFIADRIVRVAPIYWVFTFLFVLLGFFLPEVAGDTSIEFGFLLKSLFFVPAENPMGIGLYPVLNVGWTLNLEMAFYAIFAMALFFGRRYRMMVIALGVLLLQNVVPRLSSEFSIYASQGSTEFFLGIGVGILHEKGLLRTSLWSGIVLTATALFATSFADQSQDYLLVGVPFCIVLAAAISQESRFRPHTWLAAMGDWSYSTYLCHVLVLFVFDSVAQAWGINPWMMLAPCCAVILLISWFSYTFLERGITGVLKRAA